MKETSYGGTLKAKLKAELKCYAIKISDNATLGLPDSVFLIRDSKAFFIETKIGKELYGAGLGIACIPWDSINDLRQFEVCQAIGKHALVIYAIYYPVERYTAVFTTDELQNIRPSPKQMIGIGGHLAKGHGIDLIKTQLVRRGIL